MLAPVKSIRYEYTRMFTYIIVNNTSVRRKAIRYFCMCSAYYLSAHAVYVDTYHK